jgi:hypothetical protein
VNVGTITSSPHPTPRLFKLRCNPCVAVDTPKEYLELLIDLNLFSNF